MFRGDYNFFDYKYNIAGYTGQDYGGLAQNLYLVISLVLMVTILFLLRKSSKERVNKIVKVTGIFLVLFYIFKTTWESYYDITIGGAFNTGLLPFDTCSIIMWAALISGFSKGKIKRYVDSWIATGSIIGGFATMLFLNAFKYYPFFSFGAFYSMIWHFLMVFLGLLLIVTNYVDMKYSTVIKGYLFHLVFSLIVIPIDFIYNFDFMLYKDLSGIPFFEDIASKFTSNGLQFLNPIMMLLLYFVAFSLVILISMAIKKLIHLKDKH